MGLKDKITYYISEDFLNWWKTTIIGTDRQEKMLLSWWGWEACKKFYGYGSIKAKATAKQTREAIRERSYDGEENKKQDAET